MGWVCRGSGILHEVRMESCEVRVGRSGSYWVLSSLPSPRRFRLSASSSAVVCAETLSRSVCVAMHVSAECITQLLWVIKLFILHSVRVAVSVRHPLLSGQSGRVVFLRGA